MFKTPEMAAPYGYQNSTNKRLTVYESCKKIVESRKESKKDQDVSAKKTDSTLNKECIETNSCLEGQKLKMKLFACPKCNSKFEDVFKFSLHFKQHHLKNRGGQFVVLNSSEMATPQEVKNSNNKIPTVYKCDDKFEEMSESGLCLKQSHSENRGSPCGLLKSSEMADQKESQNSANKTPTIYECGAKFEDMPELGIYFKQNHLKNGGAQLVVVQNFEMAAPQEVQNSTNKISAVYEYDAKSESRIPEFGMHFKQNQLENRGGQLVVLQSSEMTDLQTTQNSTNKIPIVYKCDSRFGGIPGLGLQFKQNNSKNRGGQCRELKSSANKIRTICYDKFEKKFKSELPSKQNHLENRGGGSLKSSEIVAPQEVQNSTNKIPTVYECDAKLNEISDPGLHFKQNHLENKGGQCGVLKSSANKIRTICYDKFEKNFESELHSKQNHLENRGGSTLKSSEMSDSHGAQNCSNKRLSVYESCKKIIEARNQVQKSLSQTKSSDFVSVQQNCKLQNENSNFFQVCKQQQKSNESLGMNLLACPKCDGKFDGEEKLAKHLVLHTRKRGLCDLCHIVIPKEKDYAIHVQSHVESQQQKMNDTEVVFQLSMEEISNRSELFADNMSSFLEKLPTVNQDLPEKKTDSRFLEESTETNPWIKIKNLKMYLFACHKCDAKFEKGRELVLHLQENHSEEKGYLPISVECKLCQNIFPSKEDYAIHFQSHVIENQLQKVNDMEVEHQSSMEKMNNVEVEPQSSMEKMNSIEVEPQSSMEKMNIIEEEPQLSMEKMNNVEVECESSIEKIKKIEVEPQSLMETINIKVEPRSSEEKINSIKVEPQSSTDSISNKSHLFAEPMFLEKLPTVDRDLSEEKADSRFNKKSVEKMKLFACSKCDAEYEGERELLLHLRLNHSNKRGRLTIPVKCKLCQKIFPSKKDYVVHFRTHSEKKHVSPSSQVVCLSNVSKNAKDKKPRRSVWDDCKKVLTEKSSQQVSSANSQCVVPKLPISKKIVFMNTTPEEALRDLELKFPKIRPKHFKTPYSKTKVTNFTPHLKENQMVNYNSSSCDQDSSGQLLGESKNLDDLHLDNQVHFKTEAMDMAETDSSNFSCNVCGISFKDIEKYEAHYSTHLDEELCQIREGDEELKVCNVCGVCFTEINSFQAHLLTHVKKELV